MFVGLLKTTQRLAWEMIGWHPMSTCQVPTNFMLAQIYVRTEAPKVYSLREGVDLLPIAIEVSRERQT